MCVPNCEWLSHLMHCSIDLQTLGASPSSCSPRLEEAHRQLQKQSPTDSLQPDALAAVGEIRKHCIIRTTVNSCTNISTNFGALAGLVDGWTLAETMHMADKVRAFASNMELLLDDIHTAVKKEEVDAPGGPPNQSKKPHKLQESPAAAKEEFDDMTQEEVGNAIIDLNSAWANAKKSTTREGKNDLVWIARLLAKAVRKLALMQGMPHEQICRLFFFRLWGKPAMVVPDCLRWKVLSYLGDKDIKATAIACKDGKLIAESYSHLDPLTVKAI
jgi:hypothetical protein